MENGVNCGKPKLETARQSAAKPSVHRGKVQRLLEGYSPLNNQLERPASLVDGEIVQA